MKTLLVLAMVLCGVGCAPHYDGILIDCGREDCSAVDDAIRTYAALIDNQMPMETSFYDALQQRGVHITIQAQEGNNPCHALGCTQSHGADASVFVWAYAQECDFGPVLGHELLHIASERYYGALDEQHTRSGVWSFATQRPWVSLETLMQQLDLCTRAEAGR